MTKSLFNISPFSYFKRMFTREAIFNKSHRNESSIHVVRNLTLWI